MISFVSLSLSTFDFRLFGFFSGPQDAHEEQDSHLLDDDAKFPGTLCLCDDDAKLPSSSVKSLSSSSSISSSSEDSSPMSLSDVKP